MWWGFPVLLVLVLALQRAWDYLYDAQFTWRGLGLMVSLFALWIVILLTGGWMGGLVAVVGSFVLGALLDAALRPILGHFARRHAAQWSRKEQARFAKLLEASSSAGFYERMEDERLEEAQRCQTTLLMASIDADIQEALAAHDKHTEDLARFYFDKQLKDLPPWHRDRAVRNPRAIDYYFDTAVDLPATGPSTVLRAWVMERPAGEMPPRLEDDRQAEQALATRRRARRTESGSA